MNTKTPSPNQTAKLQMEMRRGALVLAVLSQLDEPQYGYSLKKRLIEQGLEIDEGTLYPLLRRLEEQGLLQSDWQIQESRPRRYYQINKTGRAIRETLATEWTALAHVITGLLGNTKEN
jgi:PadR family transcriptional regulator, regulatory protein PadR